MNFNVKYLEKSKKDSLNYTLTLTIAFTHHVPGVSQYRQLREKELMFAIALTR